MTIEEKKTKMAVRLGWKPVGELHPSQSYKRPNGCYDYPTNQSWDWNANTRKDILAAMTEDEEDKLISAIAGISFSSNEFTYKAMYNCLNLTQPDFFELAGQAMELWKK
jgi:hypothetical protein